MTYEMIWQWYAFCYVECQCSTEGSTGLQCDVNGKCPCKDFVEGDKCTICSKTSFDYPNCKGLLLVILGLCI